SATYVQGAHTFKAGFEIRQEKFPNYNFSNSAGIYAFGPTATSTAPTWTTQSSLVSTTVSSGFAGFGFASFLLGGISQATATAPIAAQTSRYETSVYLQDTWKVTRKLTVDYGVRWD